MPIKYYTLLTDTGAAKLTDAIASGQPLEITEMAVGDGNGALPVPSPEQTALVNERYRAPLNLLTKDPNNDSQVIAEMVIPEGTGGWWIREFAVFDSDGDMIAVANCAETYKPQLQEGSGRVQALRMILIVSNTAAVTLIVDPSIVLATHQYVDVTVSEALAGHITDPDAHPQYVTIATLRKHIPTGVPLPWPTETPPTGWLKCNGAGFNKTLYPILAAAYPSGVLPDLRAEFIRGWDDDRGIDQNRVILSEQEGTIVSISQYLSNSFMQGVAGSLGDPSASFFGDNMGSVPQIYRFVLNASSIETGFVGPNDVARARPRNVAFNYIVRAE
ncbi:phage tail fiber protein [Trabulsiella guamensis ATCC 49490]|uniref:Phage tail fiber protein n=1 Tax=Trabulsiella guamensis ATCC 49490 TaxID=1005994 RepID=A0A084ZPT2_9ENTR|nr:phage tail protein [Trabulsiella guamensis]KFB99476.1 phage tail fiber protein [Trabulsiella guamensis ATCC 49490]